MMTPETLDKLEFSRILEVVAEQASTLLGRELVRTLQPSSQWTEVQRRLVLVEQLLSVALESGYPPLAAVRDIRTALSRAGQPEALRSEDLAEIRQTLAATGPLRRWLELLPGSTPSLQAMRDRVADLTPLAAEIDLVIDDRGLVRDSASPRLAEIRESITRRHNEVQQQFEEILRQPRYRKLLQYPNTTFHDNRVVLPLKAEHHGRIPGIIHRSSQSGSTLFIEPAAVVQINNAIIQLRHKEHEEITRILSALARQVHLQAAPIRQTLQCMGELDVVTAQCRYALSRQAICPRLNDRGMLDLRQALHPALVEVFAAASPGSPPRQVIPIDIRVGDDFDVLVITGPNTGGKTVALKTVGLLAAMTQAGIPIPVAAGSTLPVYDQIFIDVGDEQSISQSLSTFSSHLTHIRDTLAKVTRQSLVLLDELGAGTDPEEGAAIGLAIIDQLRGVGCATILTTHLSQIKTAAFTRNRVDNAAVDFDVATLQPSYTLRMGEPGNSHALVIAERLGLPEVVLAAAKANLAEQHRTFAEAIAGTLESRRRAEAAREQALQAQLRAEQAKVELQTQADALAQSREKYEGWMRWLQELQPGDAVYVARFDQTAKLVRLMLHKQSALVSNGKMDLEVALSDLARPQQ
ncbi:MAG: Endonuclease MutS2 [Phycisphaerae bacterium]|nr:Endonuclease MutS2 [Phycisphaerae bacterium]